MAQQIGVKAVWDNSGLLAGQQQYIQKLGQAAQVTVNVSQNIGNVTQTINRTGPAMRRAGANARYYTQELRTLGSTLSTALGTSVGFIIANTVQRITQGIRTLGTEVTRTVTYFERMGITIRQLVAEELFDTGQASSMAAALDAATKPAQELVRWVEDLAILSPFDAKNISEGFQMALAFGFNVEQAKNLTAALTDLAAARGWDAEQVGRIAYALGQVAQATRLTGLETRQLTEAGVPVITLLAEAYGKTTREIQEMTQDGLIPAGEAIGLVFGWIEETAVGAAERTATTFSGLLNSLSDIREFAARDIFTPIGEAIKPLLQAIVDTFQDPTFRQSLVYFGQLAGEFVAGSIARLTEWILALRQGWADLNPTVKEAAITFAIATVAVGGILSTLATLNLLLLALANPFIALTLTLSGFVTAWTVGFDDMSSIAAQFVDRLSGFLDEAGSQAIDWGNAIVENLALGIESAVDMVVDAVSIIGEVLSFWLAPGSPPRILPNLDTWGTEAANVYLQGWTEADFGIVEEFGGVISDQLSALVDTGQLSELDVPRMLVGSRQAIAQAVEEIKSIGRVSETTMEQVRQAAGPAAEQIAGLISRYADVANAAQGAEAAQERLNQVTEHYENILRPLREQLEGVSNAQQDVADQRRIAALQNVIANAATTTARREEARLEIERILAEQRIRNIESEQEAAIEAEKERVTAAEQVQEEAEAILAQFQARIEAQIETLDLYGEEQKIIERINKAAAAGSTKKKKEENEALKALKEQLKAFTLQQQELQDMIKLEEARATLMDDEATAAEKAAAALTIQQIAVRQQIRDIEAAEIGASLAGIRETPIVEADWKKAKKSVEEVDGSIKDLILNYDGLRDIDQASSDFSDTVAGINERFENLNKRIEEVQGKFQPLIDNWQLFATVVGGVFAAFAVGRLISGITTLVGAIQFALPYIATVATTIGIIPLAIAGVVAAVALFAIAWNQNWFGIQERVATAVDTIKGYLSAENIENVLKTWYPTLASWIKQGVIALVDGTLEWATAIASWVGPALEMTLGFLGDFLAGVIDWLVSTALTAIVATASGIATSLAEAITNPSNEDILANTLGLVMRLLGALGTLVFDHLIPGVVKFGLDIMRGLYTGVVRAIARARGENEEVAVAFTEGMFAAIEIILGSLYNRAKNWVTTILNHVKTAAGISSPSTLFYEEVGIPMGLGLIEGLESTAPLAADTAEDFSTALLKGFGTAKTGSAQETTELANTTVAILGDMKDESTDVIGAMVTEIGNSYRQFRQETEEGGLQARIAMVIQMRTMRNSVIAEFQGLTGDVRAEISAVIQSVSGQAGAASRAGQSVGGALSRGIERGIRSNISAIARAAADTVRAAISAARNTAGIHSPSQRAADEVGQPLAEGIAQGIMRGIGGIQSAASLATAAALSSISPTGRTMQATALPGSTYNYSNTRNYNLHLNTSRDQDVVRRSFAMMEVMGT